MFRPRDPQGSLLQSEFLVPPAKARRLEKTWAEVFCTRALPLIDEKQFAGMYCEDNGRPNRAVQTVLGVLILKEFWDLTDEETLEQLEFNLLWHHALQLTAEESHLPQKTLHNFRARLIAHDGGRVAFCETTDRIISAMGIRTGRQRLDSTHIMSNMALLTRLGLFCETIRLFLHTLRRERPELRHLVSERVLRRYLKEEEEATNYEDARSDVGRRRLSVCARDLYRLVEGFRGTPAEGMEEYGLLQRLLKEQCEVGRGGDGRPGEDDDDVGEGLAPVGLKKAAEVGSDSLQSPHDPNTTYSGHKGKGYEVQVAETCEEKNPTQIITHVAVTPSCGSDAAVTVPVIDSLSQRQIQPEVLFADTTYGSGSNAVEAARRGTELVSPVAGPAPKQAEENDAYRLSAADFEIDVRAAKPTLCPAGCTSIDEHEEAPERVEIHFARETCAACPLLSRCPVRLKRGVADYILEADLVRVNIERRRREQAREEFSQRYAVRAGIEGTNSEIKRAHGLGRLRVRGGSRVELAAYLKALACNVKRMVRVLLAQGASVVRAEKLPAVAAA